MADYDVNKLTKLGALKALAEKIKGDYAKQTDFTALSKKVDGLVTAGGEPNVIEKIKVNGTEQSVSSSDKSVNITVPTAVSKLTNDSGYQTAANVTAAIAAAKHASFKVVTTLPAASAAEENVLYLFKNTATGHYDIYAKVTEGSTAKLEQLDDTTVDLSGYVKKDGSKVLSTNDFTTAYKTKLEGIDTNANKYVHPDHTSAKQETAGLFKITVDAQGHVASTAAVAKTDITALGIPGTDTKYTHPTGDGNLHVPATSTTSSGKVLTAGATAGSISWGHKLEIDVPSTAKLTDTTYSAVKAGGSAGLMSGADKTKLDGIVIADDDEVTAMLEEVFSAV